MSVVSGPTTEPAPTSVAPRRLEPGSIRASAAISTPASIQVEAGSTTVTPATMWASRMRRRARASTAASSARLLTPIVTAMSSEGWAATVCPASRSAEKTSVR